MAGSIREDIQYNPKCCPDINANNSDFYQDLPSDMQHRKHAVIARKLMKKQVMESCYMHLLL
jgi:hypothetical protein